MSNFKDVCGNLIGMLEDLDDHLDYVTDKKKHLSQPSLKKNIDSNKYLDTKENEFCPEIDKIKKTISDINSGTLGACLDCGNLIKKEHLNEMPFARLCNCGTKKSGSN